MERRQVPSLFRSVLQRTLVPPGYQCVRLVRLKERNTLT